MASVNGIKYDSSSWKGTSVANRDYRHSGDDTEYNRKSAKPKKTPKKGCPGNDHKAHVYAWFLVHYREGWIKKSLEKTCVGCDKVYTKRYFCIERDLENTDIYETRYKDSFSY